MKATPPIRAPVPEEMVRRGRARPAIRRLDMGMLNINLTGKGAVRIARFT
jgi:hypothetical protein